MTRSEALRNEKYTKYVAALAPKVNVWQSLLKAMLIGGSICLIGQLIFDGAEALFTGFDSARLSSITAMILIAAASLLTGLGVYDKIGRVGGAGSFLPITGFANAMTSASMEFRTEGLTFGTSAKMFSIAGPVLVNGVVWSTVAGLIVLLVRTIISAAGGGG